MTSPDNAKSQHTTVEQRNQAHERLLAAAKLAKSRLIEINAWPLVPTEAWNKIIHDVSLERQVPKQKLIYRLINFGARRQNDAND